MRTLITLAQTLQPIPETRYITMKLLYYDDVTPADYEPSFFRAMRDDESKVFNKDFVNLKIGQVQTQYHSLNIKVRTMSDNFEDEQGNTEEQSFPLDKSKSSGSSQWNITVAEKEATAIETPPKKPDVENNDDTQLSQDEPEVVEPPKNDKNETKTFEKELSSCGVFSFTLKDIKTKFSSKYPSISLEQMTKLVEERRKKVIDDMEEYDKTYTTALTYVLSEEFITANTLGTEIGVTTYQATKILSQMEKEGLLKASSNKRKGKQVITNETKLKEAIEMLSYIKSEKQPPAKKKDKKRKVVQDSESEEEELPKEKKVEKQVVKEKKQSPKLSPKPKPVEIDSSPRVTGVKRKTLPQFEYSYSQDGLSAQPHGSFNVDEFSQRRVANPTNKVSTITEPIEQKKRKIYRDPKAVSTL